jgi:hypothetical protein
MPIQPLLRRAVSRCPYMPIRSVRASLRVGEKLFGSLGLLLVRFLILIRNIADSHRTNSNDKS